MKTYYMHTIDGCPAFFAGDQICYMSFYGKPNPLAKSLKQIREEQKMTKQWRESKGYGFDAKEYSHRRVCI